MRFEFIVIFGIFQAIEVLSNKDECVKRKSGACKTFSISEDFDQSIPLHTRDSNGERTAISTIIEIDYMENKYSYQLEDNETEKQFDTDDNPVVEIVVFFNVYYTNSFRLVLGEKLNRLAYLETVHSGSSKRVTNYNNYAPDLPSWPFAINITIYPLTTNGKNGTRLTVSSKNGDGFDDITPFLSGNSDFEVRYIAVRSRNNDVKLVGFHDCSTKYGSYCGHEETKVITDCREKLSPFGSGIFTSFIDMSRFNRLRQQTGFFKKYEYDEIFGIYRRNDSMHIRFSIFPFETGHYIRITIDDDGISVRMRTKDFPYFEKTAVKKGWNQKPSEPNFLRIVISPATSTLSIYDLPKPFDSEPILKVKVCDQSEFFGIQFMSVSSNRFKTVKLYYDCCVPDKLDNCHIYETQNDSLTAKTNEENTTLALNEADIALMTTTDSQEPRIKNDIKALKDIRNKQLTTLTGMEKKVTFLNTSQFHETCSAHFVYKGGKSSMDLCKSDIEFAELTQDAQPKLDQPAQPNADEYLARALKSG